MWACHRVVKAMSGGKFEISVHAGGELMPVWCGRESTKRHRGRFTCAVLLYGKNSALRWPGSTVRTERQMNA
jgi:TRAP-type mannitol/chloroaromatic compound transport system substrate-binding protein